MVDLTNSGQPQLERSECTGVLLWMCTSVQLCLGASTDQEKSICVYSCLSNLSDTTVRKPLSLKEYHNFSLVLSDTSLSCPLLKASSPTSATLCHLSGSDRFPFHHLWPSFQSSQTSLRLLHPQSAFVACLWPGGDFPALVSSLVPNMRVSTVLCKMFHPRVVSHRLSGECVSYSQVPECF